MLCYQTSRASYAQTLWEEPKPEWVRWQAETTRRVARWIVRWRPHRDVQRHDTALLLPFSGEVILVRRAP